MIKKMFALILIVVFVVGCSSFTKQSADVNSVADTYRTGSEGLVMKFVENFPPSRFYDIEAKDTDSFRVMVEVQNNGAYDTIISNFYISGFSGNVIKNLKGSGGSAQENAKKSIIAKLAGKSFSSPEGSIEFVTFSGNVISLDTLGIEMFDPTILVTACYKYETIAASKICIDTNPLSIS